MKAPERARSGSCLLLEKLHVEEKRLAGHVLVIEEVNECIFTAQFLDVQRDRRGGIGAKQREKIFGRRFVGRWLYVLRDVEAALVLPAQFALPPPPPPP